MNTNLLSQYNAHKNGEVMLATLDCYKAFKSKVESAIKQDFDYSGVTVNPMDAAYIKSGDIAILDFQGFTVSNCSEIEEIVLGCISLQDFCEDLQQAVADESVNSVVINFDSGGGFTQYGYETIELIQSLKQVKPIFAVCIGGYMCSMAYNIACNCSYVIASPSAYVGSIGTILERITVNGSSELGKDGITESVLPDLGITVTTFQAGTEKTIKSETIALSQDQKAKIQANILAINAEFKQTVKANRGDVKDEFMQGQAFTGQQAIEQGTNLIDGTVNSLTEFVQLLSSGNN